MDGSLALGGIGCDGCRCTPNGSYDASTDLDCFCCIYHCEVNLGPDGDGYIEEQILTEYDCERRSSYE
ncbi:MAG: hypothetical protein AAGF92_05205 [Myxococcota bacterium]